MNYKIMALKIKYNYIFQKVQILLDPINDIA